MVHCVLSETVARPRFPTLNEPDAASGSGSASDSGGEEAAAAEAAPSAEDRLRDENAELRAQVRRAPGCL